MKPQSLFRSLGISTGLLLISSVTLLAQSNTTYAAWKTANSIPASLSPDSDPDQDGVPLLLEYALGLSPSVSSPSPYLSETLNPIGNQLQVTYPRLRNDVLYEVEGSRELLTWSIRDIITSPVEVGEEASASISLDEAKAFLRLKVSLVSNDTSIPGTASAPYPTLQNLSLEWPLSGDLNRNSIVRPRFRKAGDTEWREGLPLKRIPAGSNEGFSWAERHAGSLFDLEPDTLYEVELTLDDPDGGSTTQSLQVRTRPIPELPSPPSVIAATPSTLSSILSSLSPGDFVELGAGNYAGFSIPSSGTVDNPIIIRGTANSLITGEVSLFTKHNIHLTALNINGRIRFNGSNNIAITRCQIQGTVERQGHGIICFTRGENSYIADNTVIGTTIWNEAALGNNGQNLGEGIAVTGPGHVIEYNRVRGFRDGISFLEDDGAVDQQSIDILNNEISECGDDGIEADFAMGNCRIMRNRITNTFISISSQPSLGGPTYFIRNAAYNITHVAFKLYRASQGDVLYHNTIVKNGDGFATYTTVEISHLCSRNNLFLGGAGGSFNGFNSGSGKVLDIRAIDLDSSDLNGDAFGSSTGFEGSLDGNVDFSSLAQLRNLTTETNAQQASLADFDKSIAYPANPLTLYPAQDLRPSTANNLVKKALPLPNINLGNQATIGAYEPGASLPQYGPR